MRVGPAALPCLACTAASLEHAPAPRDACSWQTGTGSARAQCVISTSPAPGCWAMADRPVNQLCRTSWPKSRPAAAAAAAGGRPGPHPSCSQVRNPPIMAGSPGKPPPPPRALAHARSRPARTHAWRAIVMPEGQECVLASRGAFGVVLHCVSGPCPARQRGGAGHV